MENIEIVNFPKNSVTVEIIDAKTKEKSIHNKDRVAKQLIGYTKNKKLSFDIKRVYRDHDFEGYPFIIQNKNNKIITIFEDKTNPYYEMFEKLYLEAKLKKEQKIKRIKVFKSGIAAAIVSTAIIGGMAYMGMEAYDKELDYIRETNEQYIEQINQVNQEEEHMKILQEENRRIAEEEKELVEKSINNSNSFGR